LPQRTPAEAPETHFLVWLFRPDPRPSIDSPKGSKP
jgi:hypothetical protein